MQKKYVINIDGKELIFEFGKYAKFANESVMVRYGDTAVLVTVTASKDVKEGIDFFPLSVDYTERLYSVGKIPGGFIKREGKPTDNAILVSRCIDRPMRPLFPKDLRNACLIDAMVMSADQDYNPEFVAMIGANMAVHVSDVPFNGPIATVNIGMIDGEYILNPTENERKHSILDLNLAGSKEKIVMIEAGANELTDIEMIEAIKFGHKYIKELCEFQDKVRKEIGKEKFEYTNIKVPENLEKYIIENYGETIDKAIINTNKEDLDNTINEIIKVVKETYTSKIENEENRENLKILNEEYKYISDAVTKIEKEKIRQNVIEKGIRVDGRNTDEVRKLNAEVGNLPRVHGSGLFERGETQVLSVLTLGKVSEEQRLDGVNPEETKRYMHQYNFPGFSTGEAKPSRGPGRREVGHGALAEKALIPVLPNKEEFPYAIRVVSEVLGSNGSTSQASVCGSTLCLMDGGVPIKRPVAGISTGLFTHKDNKNYTMVTDIQGTEDFFGDMDFKVAGTEKGITAIQVDIKIDGLTYEIIEEAFERCNKARHMILNDVMKKAISEPRKNISTYAPQIAKVQIEVDKIKDLIGPSGKNINKIIDETKVEIDIDDNGLVLVYGNQDSDMEKAMKMIEESTKVYKVGEIVTGIVTSIQKFGAFITLPGNKEGLLHISKISEKRVDNVEDVLKIGDEVTTKIENIDTDGKIALNRKDIFKK